MNEEGDHQNPMPGVNEPEISAEGQPEGGVAAEEDSSQGSASVALSAGEGKAASDSGEMVEERPSLVHQPAEPTHVPLFDRLMQPAITKELRDADAADVQAKVETTGVEPIESDFEPVDDFRISVESSETSVEVSDETRGAEFNVPLEELPAEAEIEHTSPSAGSSIIPNTMSQASVPVRVPIQGPLPKSAGMSDLASTLLIQATILRQAYVTASQAANQAGKLRELAQARYEIDKWHAMAPTRLAAVHPPLRLLFEATSGSTVMATLDARIELLRMLAAIPRETTRNTSLRRKLWRIALFWRS